MCFANFERNVEQMNKKILLVDDDESILLLYSNVLKHYQYKTATLTTTKDLLNIVKETQPDLIILDIWIPEIGGEAAAELLKNDLATYEIPILFISANADADVIATKVGANGYINKPFELAELVHKIEEIFEEKAFDKA